MQAPVKSKTKGHEPGLPPTAQHSGCSNPAVLLEARRSAIGCIDENEIFFSLVLREDEVVLRKI